MLMPEGHTPGLKVGYVLVYSGGTHDEKDGSIQPLLGVLVLGAPPMGVGLPTKTAKRLAHSGGGVKTVVRAARLVEVEVMVRRPGVR